MAHQAALETHTFYGHIGGLAVAVSARNAVCSEDVLTVSTIGFDRFQQFQSLAREWDNVCATFLMRSAGIVQIFFSISAQRVVAASAGRVIVWNCHSIRHRVVLLMLALAIATMSSFSSSGGSAAIFFFFGFLKTERIPLSGLAWMSP